MLPRQALVASISVARLSSAAIFFLHAFRAEIPTVSSHIARTSTMKQFSATITRDVNGLLRLKRLQPAFNLSFDLCIVFCFQSSRQQRLGLFEASVSENPLENAIWLIFKLCSARQHANKSPRIPFRLVQIDNCKADYPTRQRKIVFGYA